MEIIPRDEIKEQSILDSTDSKYIRGYFTDKTKINNNDDFIEVYRYVQYWKLPITEELRNYVLMSNYSPKSLIENMRLTGEDSYFEELKLGDKIFDDIETEEELTSEEILEKPEYIKSGCDQGVQLNFDLITKNNATKYIHYLKYCSSSIDDDEICNLFNKQLGGVASIAITYTSDLNYIFNEEFYPLDYDALNLYLSQYDITEERAEFFIFMNLEKSRNIDITMFMKLLESIPTNYYRIILGHVLRRNNKLLMYLVMKFMSEHIDNNEIEEMIMFSVKSKEAYIVYRSTICNDDDYEKTISNSEIIDDEIW